MQQGRGSVGQPEPLPVWLKPRVSCCKGPSCRFSIASLLGDAGAASFPAELAPVSQPLLTGPVLQLPHLGGPLLSKLLLVLVFLSFPCWVLVNDPSASVNTSVSSHIGFHSINSLMDVVADGFDPERY